MRLALHALRATAAAALVSLAACATTPPTDVHQPMSVLPPQNVPMVKGNGSIYQPALYAQNGYRYMPLFEDRRARNVGDTLVIQIDEKTDASKSSTSDVSHKGSSAFSVPLVSGLPGKGLQGAGLGASSDTEFAAKGDSASNNDFTGTIAVTVTQVLGNGNLVVSGEKQVGINQGSEYIRFSGVVNPANIQSGNVVSSTQVADAKIEYRGNGQVNSAQVMGWLARFFMTVLPF